jgi:hypothetical protein
MEVFLYEPALTRDMMAIYFSDHGRAGMRASGRLNVSQTAALLSAQTQCFEQRERDDGL